jgi:hypothetical protein
VLDHAINAMLVRVSMATIDQYIHDTHQSPSAIESKAGFRRRYCCFLRLWDTIPFCCTSFWSLTDLEPACQSAVRVLLVLQENQIAYMSSRVIRQCLVIAFRG